MRKKISSKTVLPGYDKRLAIIVPYRDRAEHLKQFLLHMDNYFQRDKLDRNIDYSIHVVEQCGDAPFNRGKIKNCGFSIAQDKADYFCFHDVDYLPLWADYSYPKKPARLIWHGLTLKEDHELFFGGVVLFTKHDFLKVNGYSNDYWGWGFEDNDLRLRCIAAKLGFEKRDGTFQALKHKNAGNLCEGKLTEEGQRNGDLFQKKKETLQDTYRDEGLNTLSFELVRTAALFVDGKPARNVFLHKVTI